MRPWRGRRSGYPFSGPRSRPKLLANWHSFVNTVTGAQFLWQARMGPAPGHPNHQPNSGLARHESLRSNRRTRRSRLSEPHRLFRRAPPRRSRRVVGFAGAGPIRGCLPCGLPNTALTQWTQNATGSRPRAWAGERESRRPPVRGISPTMQDCRPPVLGSHQSVGVPPLPKALARSALNL